MIRVCLAGEGAQGETYMQVISQRDDIEVVALVGGIESNTIEFARRWHIPFWTLDLAEGLAHPGVDAVILGTPSADHYEQAMLSFQMGKHQLLEIPMALSLKESKQLADMEQQHLDLVSMVAHTRRYSPIALEIERRVIAGELTPYHFITETHFFRRENLNRFGEPRTWVDNLLWHHACHYIDQIYSLYPKQEWHVWAQCGPNHPELNTPMELSFNMRSEQGVLVTSSYSFNHHGPFGGQLKVIAEEDTLLMKAPSLYDHQGNELVRNEANAPFIGIIDEFIMAIQQQREAKTSYNQCLPAMEIIDRAQRCLDEN